jgi:hypothetical protein
MKIESARRQVTKDTVQYIYYLHRHIMPRETDTLVFTWRTTVLLKCNQLLQELGHHSYKSYRVKIQRLRKPVMLGYC